MCERTKVSTIINIFIMYDGEYDSNRVLRQLKSCPHYIDKNEDLVIVKNYLINPKKYIPKDVLDTYYAVNIVAPTKVNKIRISSFVLFTFYHLLTPMSESEIIELLVSQGITIHGVSENFYSCDELKAASQYYFPNAK